VDFIIDFVKNWIIVFLFLLLAGAIVVECAVISSGCEEEKAHNTALMDKCIAKIKTLHLGPSEAKSALDLCWKTEGGLP
jgi:hypothetical protein